MIATILGLLIGGGSALLGGVLASLLMDRLERRPARVYPRPDGPIFNPTDYLLEVHEQ